MRQLILFAMAVMMSIATMAQSPDKMSYQAVVRNSNNQLLTNTAVGIKISILQGSTSGSSVFTETHTPTTNANGLLTIEIGGGTAVAGAFASINWSTGPFFLKTEIDPAGGSNYSITGTSQLLSVPYALHAKTAESLSGNETDPVYNASVAKSISSSDTAKWNHKLSSYTEGQTLSDVLTKGSNGNGMQIKNIANPTDAQDAVTKAYIDALIARIDKLETFAGVKVTDADGNTYKTVSIGSQIWMAENLKVTKYSNGDTIGTTYPSTLDLSAAVNPAYQWAYNGADSNVAKYGRLYTWYAVTDSRKLCPNGWHAPTETDWTILENFLGISVSALKLKEAGTSHWMSPNTGATNETGFTALPGGGRWNTGAFANVGKTGYWWSGPEITATTASSRLMQYNSPGTASGSSNKAIGLSVRCVKD